ncbi:MAG: TIGR04282 family arsenosugar biosynthesis glycosyltransferase [Candidatus Binatia bacterium]
MAMAANALVIMTKAPEAGQSKTRLVPPLSYEEAAGLARALLLDQFRNLAKFSAAHLFTAFTPKTSARFFGGFGPQGFSSFLQQGETLGERMRHAFEYLFGRNFHNVILIGGDLPTVPLAFFEQGYASLDRAESDVVLGPSLDGGYYLIGMNRLIPEIFEGIIWSRNDVLSRTTEKLAGLRINYELLPFWYDIDTLEDLERLRSQRDFGDDVMKNTMALLHEFRRTGRL